MAVAIVAVGIATVLCGCTVPNHGVLGFFRTSDGVIAAVVQMCGHHKVDSIDIFTDNGSDLSITKKLVQPVTDFGSVVIKGLEGELHPRLQYFDYAGSTDGDSVAWGPDVSTESLGQLLPGQVIAPSEKDINKTSVMTVEEFQAESLRKCSWLG